MTTSEDGSKGSANSPFWRKKLPGWMVLIGLAVIIFRMLHGQPVDIQITYHYGSAKTGLQRTVIRYLQKSDELRRVVFDYRLKRPSKTQEHRVSLPEGEYDVLITLFYKAGAVLAAFGKTKDKPVQIKRLLLVHGAGAVNIYIAQ